MRDLTDDEKRLNEYLFYSSYDEKVEEELAEYRGMTDYIDMYLFECIKKMSINERCSLVNFLWELTVTRDETFDLLACDMFEHFKEYHKDDVLIRFDEEE